MHIVALIPHPKTALSSLLIADAASAVEPGSTITALHVCVDPAKIGGSVEEVDMQEMRIRDEGTAFQRRNEVRKIFEEWSAGREPSPAGAKVEWVEADGGEEDGVRKHLGSADLVTIAHPQSMDGGDALHAALFDHHRLVVFTPDTNGTPVSFGRSIAIFWRDDDGIRSCLQKARAWLRAADTLVILAAHENEVPEAVGFIQSLHVSGTGRLQTSVAKNADDFLEKANRGGADTLLMGAYRHGLFLETVFGGATKTVMDHTSLPVFLSH